MNKMELDKIQVLLSLCFNLNISLTMLLQSDYKCYQVFKKTSVLWMNFNKLENH